MVSLHKVREHFKRKGTHVNTYTRGEGEGKPVQQFSGEYKPTVDSRPKQPSEGTFARLRKRFDESNKKYKLQKEIADAQRMKARKAAQEEEEARRAEEKQKRIVKQEEIRAREGGSLKRGAKYAARLGFAYLQKEYGGKKRKGTSERKSKRSRKARRSSSRRFTTHEDREALRIAQIYERRGFSPKEARRIGYATVNAHRNGEKT